MGHTIYNINAALPAELQEETLEHELEHIRADHLYRDDCEIARLEAAADHQAPTPPPAPLQIIPPAPQTGATQMIPFYPSLSALLAQLKASGEFQRMIDAAHDQNIKLYGID